MTATDVAIIGGGIAGLSAAFELHRRNVSFTVLERGPRAGGVILSEEIDGFTVDAGPDALLVQKPDAIRLCEEIGLTDALVPTQPPRIAYIQRGGRLHPLPASSVLGIPTRIRPFVTTSLFSMAGKLRMAGEVLVPQRPGDGDESIASFMNRRFGTEATTYLAEPLLAGIHAGDVNRLSIRSLFPRLVEMEQKHGSLLRGFRRRGPGPVSVDGAFRSLPGGLSQMVSALTAALPGGAIVLGRPVTGIAAGHGPAPFTIDAGGVPLTAKAVILATPAYVTGALVREVDSELSRLCGEIPYASTATVALAYRRDDVAHPLNGSGFVVPRVESAGILAASWLSSKWPHRAPAGKVLMRTFVGGARDPRALEPPDEELVRISLSALTPLLGIRAAPLFARVYRWTRASAQHEVGHAALVGAIERALARRPGVFVTGSGFRGVGIPDCVADGRATGRQVAAWIEKGQRPR